jgi:hypothetical protein
VQLALGRFPVKNILRTYKVTQRRVPVTTLAVEKQYYIFRVFVTLVIQHAKRTRRTVMWPVRVYHSFTHNVTNGTVFGKITKQNACSDFLYNFSLKHVLILRRIQRDITINLRMSSRKVLVILVRF